MRFPRLRLFEGRRAIRALESLADSQRQQTLLLARIADRLAPPVEDPLDEKAVRKVTEISYSRDVEQGAIEVFTQSVYEATGHIPTEDEIVAFLDERLGTSGVARQ